MKIATIHFRQSGGFAGLVRGGTVPYDTVPAALRVALEHHLASAAKGAAGAGQARDTIGFEIDLETDRGPRRLLLDETEIPEPLVAFVAWLQKHAKPMKP